jgi:hypothetical protein
VLAAEQDLDAAVDVSSLQIQVMAEQHAPSVAAAGIM